MRTHRLVAAFAAAALVCCGSAVAVPPEYNIVDMGVVSGDIYSQGFGISANGMATGRSLAASGSTHAFLWSQASGLVPLPNLMSPLRNYGCGNGLNMAGKVVGTGAATAWGTDPLPLIWVNGGVSQLPLPPGYTLGRAQDINDFDVVVGSAGGGSSQRAAIYAGGSGSIITQTTPQGCFANVAYAINNSNRIVGTGIDPHNAARNVGFVFERSTGVAYEVGGLPGHNGALCFDVSNAGHIVGTSMYNQGSGLPFIWTDADGIQPIPLPPDAILGEASGVNSAGWVVGTAASAYALPFLFDGTATYLIGDLIPPGTGWDLLTNTSSSAMGISDDGIIIGTGELHGVAHAYALIPIPEPTTILLAAAAGVLLRRRG